MNESGRGHEKVRAVIDTSVFVAGLYWQGSARECLVRFARREFQWFATSAVLQEFASLLSVCPSWLSNGCTAHSAVATPVSRALSPAHPGNDSAVTADATPEQI